MGDETVKIGRIEFLLSILEEAGFDVDLRTNPGSDEVRLIYPRPMKNPSDDYIEFRFTLLNACIYMTKIYSRRMEGGGWHCATEDWVVIKLADPDSIDQIRSWATKLESDQSLDVLAGLNRPEPGTTTRSRLISWKLDHSPLRESGRG